MINPHRLCNPVLILALPLRATSSSRSMCDNYFAAASMVLRF